MRRKVETQDVVVRYTKLHQTMEEIGQHYGVTRQAIQKRLRKAGISSEQGERVQVECSICGKGFSLQRKRWHRTERYHCSTDCYLIRRSSPDYIPWRQGARLARIIVRQYFELQPEHIVHHEDKSQRNNKLDNLRVFANQSDHLKYHHGKDIKPIWDGRKPYEKLT